MSIWKTSCCYGINPAQILTVRVFTCESALRSRDTPKPCTSACSENRLMTSLNNYPVTYCLFIIVCRCSLACYDLYYHSDCKSQATWTASHGRWHTKMYYESKHLLWRVKLGLKCSDFWMETSQNSFFDGTSIPQVHLFSIREEKKGAKSLTNHPLNCSSKDCSFKADKNHDTAILSLHQLINSVSLAVFT